MRKLDLEALRAAYDNLLPTDRVDVSPDVWGAAAPSVRKLKNEVFRDLDVTAYGVYWWASYKNLGTKRRILIGDYLYQCCAGLESNLVEARLHLLSALHFGDEVRTGMQGMVYIGQDNEPRIRHEPKPSIDAHIIDHFEEMHFAGFFRAIGSVADCLSSIITGVVALPINIFSCGYSAVMNKFRELEKKRHLHPLQMDFLNKLDGFVGSDGWLDWALAYRNMLTHRGRMVQMKLLDWSYAEESGKLVLGDDGLPKLQTDPVSLLPREPDLSEVEVLRNDLNGLLLTEDAETTANGVFDRMARLSEAACAELNGIWCTRREKPGLVDQPKQQWPNGDRTTSLVFKGFSPEKYAFSPGDMSVHPTRTARMRSASLIGADKDKWKDFR